MNRSTGAIGTIACLVCCAVFSGNADSLQVMPGPLISIPNPSGTYCHMPFLSIFGNTAVASFSQHPDAYLAHPVDGMRISRDTGRTWTEYLQYPDFYLTSCIQRRSGRLFGMAYICYYVDSRHARAHFWDSPDTGRSWTHDSGTVTFPGNIFNDTSLGNAGWSSMLFHRTMMEMADGSLQGTMYGFYSGDTRFRCVWVKSTDNGRNWSVVSTIAHDEVTGSEGFGEPVVERCLDGSLLCVMRVGSWKGLYQCRSLDTGKTWSTPVTVFSLATGGVTEDQTRSVDPDLCLMSTGVLVLSFGRPASRLLFSLDGSGRQWSNFVSTSDWDQSGGTANPVYWSGYTGIREVSRSKLLLLGEIRTQSIWQKFITVGRGLEPVFSPEGSAIRKPTGVIVTCATPGAAIRYTLNGADPTSSSALYTSPVIIAATATLKARGFKSGMDSSSVTAATYTYTSPIANATFIDLMALYKADASTISTDMTWSGTPHYGITGAIDGSVAADYSSCKGDKSLPGYYTIKLDKQYSLAGIGVCLKPDYKESADIYVSNDGVNWGNPVKSYTLVDQHDLDFTTFASPPACRNVKVVVTSGNQG